MTVGSKVERIVAIAWKARQSPKNIMVNPLCYDEVAQIEAILGEKLESDGQTPEQVLHEAQAVYVDRAYDEIVSARTQN